MTHINQAEQAVWQVYGPLRVRQVDLQKKGEECLKQRRETGYPCQVIMNHSEQYEILFFSLEGKEELTTLDKMEQLQYL